MQVSGIILSVLEGLDEINWAAFNHAYGPATDVPHLLRQLLSTNEELRSQAMFELYGNIWHQHTVYEATAFAVPFLIDLLQSPCTPDRISIATLLGLIARGRSYHEVHNPAKEADVARELVWVKNARDAVRGGIEVYLRLLAEDSCQLRLAAAHLLACFPEEVHRTRQPLLDSLTAESQTDARAVFGLALALLGELRREAFKSTGASDLPLQRLELLAEGSLQRKVTAEDALNIILDLATDSFDQEHLDNLDTSGSAS